MTSLLSDVLQERADGAGSPRLDLDLVIAHGERQLRRRRLAGMTGVGLLAAATITAFAVIDLPSDRQSAPAAGTSDTTERGDTLWSTHALSYSDDSTIHVVTAEADLDVGQPIRSYVATDDGFVWTAEDGTVSFQPADGSATRAIGSTSRDGYYLRADDTGSLAAWVDWTEPGGPSLVVYDTAEGAEVLRESSGTGPGMAAYRDAPEPVYVYAVDDGSVYWLNESGIVRTEVATATSTVLGQGNGFSIDDVATGVIASRPDGTADRQETLVGPSLTEGRTLPNAGHAQLSPDGRTISFEDADELVVRDVATGQDLSPVNPGYEYWVVTQWVDDHDVAVMGLRSLKDLDNPSGPDTAPLDFLHCDVADGSCRVVTSTVVDLDAFNLPVGASF